MLDRSLSVNLRSLGWAAVAMIVLVGCQASGDTLPDDVFPIVANADLATGSQRLLVGLVTADATSYASPDRPVEIDLYAPGANLPTETVTGTFTWTVPDVRGLYTAGVEFGVPGEWRISVRAGDAPATTLIPFNVAAAGRTPAVGDQAPAVPTLTSPPAEIEMITSDPDPDPRFYELSLDEAVASGHPTVVVFATPAWCETATCGPMLQTVKDIAAAYPTVNFVHVEIYEDPNGVTDPAGLRIVEAVEAWKLPSEPWVFVVAADGLVAAKFEGTLREDELTAVLEGHT